MLRKLLTVQLLTVIAVGTSLGIGWGAWQAQQLLETPEQPSESEPEATPQGTDIEALGRLVEASEALTAGQAAQALEHLRDLEIPALDDQILMLRAIAYERGLSPVSATQQWQLLLDRHPNSPLVPRALVGLGRQQIVIERYAAHPLAVEPLRQALHANPQNWVALENLAQHHPTTAGLVTWLDGWQQVSGLSAAQWQIIADAYWAQREYGRASRAYAYTEASATNVYRLARSHQISREVPQAITTYNRLMSQFPDAEVVPEARLYLADLVDAATAIAGLRILANQSHPESATALLRLVRLYEQSYSPEAAQAAQAELWQRFSRSEAAATLAWERAAPLAEAGNWEGAIAIVNPLFDAQPDTDEGARLGFWRGKWYESLGQVENARSSWRRVFREARNTYFGWRSADLLGLPVGDLQSGRRPIAMSYTPAILELPRASEAVQLLHLSGAATLAWERWQWEGNTTSDPDTHPETHFTAGVLRNRAGDRLRGINQVAQLLTAEDQTAIAHLKGRPDFWQAVYPLHHFETLVERTDEFNLNPLILASLIRQESRFEPEIVSVSGALGLTQVLPSTGQWIAEQLGVSQFNLRDPDDNLYFGSWYLDYTHRSYQDNTLLAVASYNAGPGSVGRWVQEFGTADLDVFAERIPYAETNHYVRAVLGNYWNYLQLYVPDYALIQAPSSDG